ncbi:SDR family NAD(P)-dependent oxidoreductase [Gayadomonas joobiniege]|uniref:SDR family NAD(P)-dependent oxidoreductase n=1 Tax=Gayadomonas joobiniege TaxID=1234606 RepID=UPI00036EF966|nr:SDR family oxidoreductase [Gayadomonas joobiniege]
MTQSFNPLLLNNQLALITGGSTGIGFAIAKAFVAVGCQVCITGRREALLKQAQQQLGDRATYYCADVNNDDDRQSMVLHAERTFNRNISILVNNAGQNIKQAAVDVPLDSFNEVLNTHLTSAFALAQLVAPKMLHNNAGNIIFLASMVSFIGVPNVIAYSAAKAGVLGLTRGLAAEWSAQNVRVNAIAPGWIHTPMTDKAFADDRQRKQKVLSRTPMQTMGEPDDIAQMAVYLCSPASKFVTGQIMRVDGGAEIGF